MNVGARDAADEVLPPNQGRSWWLREALSHPEFAEPESTPLRGRVEADVVIVGGGFAGMWTAFHLKEREPAIDVVLLEQDICGGGPSGRNGGFVNSWWSDLSELCDRLGDEQALALCKAGSESLDAIGSFCERFGVDAWFKKAGDLGVADSPSQIGMWEDDVLAAKRLDMAAQLTPLDAEQVRAICDSPLFLGGCLDRDGATVQPARLARGLRRVIIEKGVRVHEASPVRRFGWGTPAIAETTEGSVRAGSAVIAINAWAAAWKRFRRNLTVRGSYIVLTEPAPERLSSIGWTGGQSIWDHRSALHYLRTTPDGRIALGIGGVQPSNGTSIGPAYSWFEKGIRIAARGFRRLFPMFDDIRLEAGWGGPIDVSGSHLPFFSSEGNVHHGLGFTGNGVGPCELGGRILAVKVLGLDDPLLRLPIVDREPPRFPPRAILSPGQAVVNSAMHRRDRALDRDEEPNPLIDFAAKLPRMMGYNLGP